MEWWENWKSPPDCKSGVRDALVGSSPTHSTTDIMNHSFTPCQIEVLR